jgi:putative ABC transport system substrate-binding protein
VGTLARPDGNLTGVNFFNAELNAKRLELLHELVPGMRRVGVLLNPANPVNAQTILSEVEAAARALGLQTHVLNATTISEIDTVFETLKREPLDALFVSGDPLFNNRRLQLALLAARNEIPAAYSSRDYPEYGGLMSYGADVTDAFRQLGDYVGRILKGTKPADLPVVQASKFELVINIQAARLLGLKMPPMLLARADEVIE